MTTRPTFDPELAPVVEAARQSFPPLSAETLPMAREVSLAEAGALDLTAGGAVRVEERQVPGPEGAPDLTVLILSPVDDSRPKPGMYHIHGGGMVMGDRRLGLQMLLPYVAEGAAVVVSAEYRMGAARFEGQ
ncbi:alpha/beta hydrolase family protein [Actinacidiphila oryziradicis]|uniref:Alpha/beta hydrolase n=1 Tax=Actinacidiphila oryziradicis TaxID=2571141 RepID=A0A4V5MWE1_9ACTN|nr:hypothetical protein [Actinacidiphila oryziradicis]TJZ95828.1 hypothetical protein FCI23_51835 [Actinacidiphila oryziradicis]